MVFEKIYGFYQKHFQILIGFLHVFVTKSVGNRFHELSLGRNDRLGLGTSKIEVLAKNSKKNQGKSMIFLVFPACGPGSGSGFWFLVLVLVSGSGSGFWFWFSFLVLVLALVSGFWFWF